MRQGTKGREGNGVGYGRRTEREREEGRRERGGEGEGEGEGERERRERIGDKRETLLLPCLILSITSLQMLFANAELL